MKRETFVLNQQGAKPNHHKLLSSRGSEAGELGDTKVDEIGEGLLKGLKITVCRIEGGPLFLQSLYQYHSKLNVKRHASAVPSLLPSCDTKCNQLPSRYCQLILLMFSAEQATHYTPSLLLERQFARMGEHHLTFYLN